MVQFAAQILFLIVVTGISLALGFGNVETAQFGQALSTVTGLAFFWIGWTKLFPPAPASHTLPAGHSLLTEGFLQLFRTAKMIHRDYSHGLRWFLYAVVFAEAAANAFTVVAVIYLDEHIGMSGPEIGIFFVATLVGTIPGTQLGKYVTNRLDPNRSWQLSMVCIVIWSTLGALGADYLPTYLAYLWGLLQGMLLGWFYPAENLFFSMCLPKGHEAVSLCRISRNVSVHTSLPPSLTHQLPTYVLHRNCRVSMCTVRRFWRGCLR
jgi:MFS-type transporter involved in bile tolerance (Atg22 family)